MTDSVAGSPGNPHRPVSDMARRAALHELFGGLRARARYRRDRDEVHHSGGPDSSHEGADLLSGLGRGRASGEAPDPTSYTVKRPTHGWDLLRAVNPPAHTEETRRCDRCTVRLSADESDSVCHYCRKAEINGED